ncbi:DUF5995 family protein, partial [Cellulomonas fimi]|uniref:DUF5995 family protein n=1 Tax=Cellulomonas fimi TaxID=1708 RepID=UPI00234CFF49
LDACVGQHAGALSPFADLVTNFSIDKARDAAWVSAQVLWEVRSGVRVGRRGRCVS